MLRFRIPDPPFPSPKEINDVSLQLRAGLAWFATFSPKHGAGGVDRGIGVAACMTTLTLLHVLTAAPLPGGSQHIYQAWVDTVQNKASATW